MATLQEIAEKYGDIDDNGQPLDSAKAKWIELELTDRDIHSWHDGKCTNHTRRLMKKMGVECIEIWGSNDGGMSEPLKVVLC